MVDVVVGSNLFLFPSLYTFEFSLLDEIPDPPKLEAVPTQSLSINQQPNALQFGSIKTRLYAISQIDGSRNNSFDTVAIRLSA